MAENKTFDRSTVEGEIKELIDTGKDRGFLTYEELNDFLPDDVVSPEYIDEVLLTLDEKGIELVDEAEVEEGENGLYLRDEEAEESEEEEEEETETVQTTEKIDDPVRIYLTQMGQIPLLARSEEIALAKRIEISRKAFRRRILQFTPCVEECVQVLADVRDGDLPFDRTLNVAAEPEIEKDEMVDRVPLNLETVNKLLERNREDWQAYRAAKSEKKKVQMLRAIRSRSYKCMILMEELHLRIKRIQPLMDLMNALYGRFLQLDHEISQLGRTDGNKAKKRALEAEVRHLEDRICCPFELLRRRMESVRLVHAQYERAKQELCGGNLRLVVSHRQEVPQPRPELPGPDPGGQHRPDAGGGQVRVPPRLQVQHLRHVVDPPGHHPRHRRPGPHHPHPRAHDRDDEQAAQHLQEAGAGAGPRADHRGDRRGGQAQRQRDAARAEDQQRPDQPGPPRRRERGQLLRRLHRGRDGRSARCPRPPQEMLKDRIDEVLKTLTYREREIIKLRYGIGDGYTYTLEEVGRIFKVTRERVRQIEAKAVRKLQHPVRSRQLEGFIDSLSGGA